MRAFIYGYWTYTTEDFLFLKKIYFRESMYTLFEDK